MQSKFLFLIGGLLAIAACSSGQKKQEATMPATIVQTTKEVTIPVVAQPSAKTESKQNEIVCERGQEKRTLYIEAVEPKGCKLWYSHYSTKDPVASSKIANTHCEKVQTIIRGHLEEAKFNCSGGEATVAKTMVATTTPATTPAPTATPKATVAPTPTPTPAAKHSPTPKPSSSATPAASPTATPAKK
ncbi:MAG: hypothetical protein JSU04_07130 [Bdellovibrionales bacterium]|nr:hypothetical protein [Bdellovibrionales bacterium]